MIWLITIFFPSSIRRSCNRRPIRFAVPRSPVCIFHFYLYKLASLLGSHFLRPYELYKPVACACSAQFIHGRIFSTRASRLEAHQFFKSVGTDFVVKNLQKQGTGLTHSFLERRCRQTPALHTMPLRARLDSYQTIFAAH